MPASFVTIRAAIKSKLEGLIYNAGSNPSGVLMQVKDHHEENFTGFPAATMEMSNGENNFYSNTDNMRGYAFDVYLWFECESGGRGNAETVRCATVDAVIAAFDTDYNLGGACDWSMPVTAGGGSAVIGGATFLYAKLIVKCQAEITVVS